MPTPDLAQVMHPQDAFHLREKSPLGLMAEELRVFERSSAPSPSTQAASPPPATPPECDDDSDQAASITSTPSVVLPLERWRRDHQPLEESLCATRQDDNDSLDSCDSPGNPAPGWTSPPPLLPDPDAIKATGSANTRTSFIEELRALREVGSRASLGMSLPDGSRLDDRLSLDQGGALGGGYTAYATSPGSDGSAISLYASTAVLVSGSNGIMPDGRIAADDTAVDLDELTRQLRRDE